MDTKYHLRRRVKTGGYERRRFGRGKVDIAQSHYGMRVVCTKCAHVIDLQEHRLRVEGHLQVLAALMVLMFLLILAKQGSL